MLNFRFIKAQFKTVWGVILGFLIIFTILIAFMNVFPVIGEKQELNIGFTSHTQGAAMFLNTFTFGIGSFAVFLAFGIAMNIILINKDINQGYIVSWLTTSVTRKSIFNSKLFIIIISTLILNVWIIFVEMASFSLRMEDFKPVVWHLLLGNLGLLCFSLMTVSGTWFVFAMIRKTGVALAILLGLGLWFAFCYLMANLSVINGLENLKYFKYFTIQSLLNSPMKFAELTLSSSDENIVEYAKILPIKAVDYAWQLPFMIVAATGLFIYGQFIIKNKDFSF